MIELNELMTAAGGWSSALWKASWQGAALAALTGLALWVARVRAPAMRHAAWTSAAALMLLTPWMNLPQRVPGIEMPVSDAIYLVVTAGAGSGTAVPPAAGFPWRVAAGALWLAGFAFFALRRLAGVWWMRRTIASARPVPTQARGARWLETRNVRAPVAAGLLKPAVLLPEGWREWPEHKRQSVTAHEMAHVRRGDPWFLALAAWNRAVFWFHPVAWWLEAKIASEAELACDDEASQSVGDRRIYAQALVEIAAGAAGVRLAPGAAMAGAAPVTRRVERLLAQANWRSGLLGKRQWAVVSSLALTAFLGMIHVRPTLAQAGDTAIEGAVADPQGRRVIGAQVLLLDEGSDEVAKTVTKPDGSYRISVEQAGAYTLLVLADGFEPYRRSRLPLVQGAVATHEAQLTLGSIQEVLSVGGVAAQTGTGGVPTRIRVGGKVQKARLLKVVRPSYPPEARKERVQGTVILDAVIDKDGAPVELFVRPNGVDHRLADEAVQSVKQWRYKPTLLNGVPVEVVTQVQVNFTLSE